MINKIIISYIDGSNDTYNHVDHYCERDGFLNITSKFKPKDVTLNKVFTDITRINLRNIFGYTICINENGEEDTDNG